MAEPAAARPTRRRWLRWVLIALAVLVLLPAAALAVLVATFDAEALKPRIEAAVEGATGRDLTLAGPVSLKLSLTPTVTLDGLTLANIPGGSRPEMARVRRVEVQLALLPLLSRRVELRRVLLQAPDILLETTAEGRPNWVFSPPEGASPPAPAPAPIPAGPAPEEPGRGFGIALDRLAITEGRVTWRDGATGRSRSLAVPRLAAETQPGGERLRLDGTLAPEGLSFALHGETGSLARLLEPGGAANPWPLALALEGEGARVAVEGSLPRASGWSLAATAQVADLARFAPLLPDAPLPPLRDLALAAKAADSGGAVPTLSDLRLTVGESDLNALLPGLRLLRLAATQPRGDGPLALEAEARAGEAPLRLAGTLGSPLLLAMPPTGAAAAQPWPLDLTLGAAGATLAAKGTVADPRALTGVDLAVSARVPDLAALAPLAGRALPPVRDLSLGTRLAERGPGFAGGAFLRGLRLDSSAGDVAGDLTWVVGQRQGVNGQLASRRLDLDALRATAPAGPATSAAPSPPSPAGDGRVIPDLPLPLGALRVTDSALQWTLDEVHAAGVAMREAQVALAIQDGRAWLDPLAATLPGGRITLRGAADVTTDPPTVQLAAQGGGLDLPALLGAFGVAQRPGSGRADLQADLRGQGRDLRAVAATAHGSLALALADLRLPPGLVPTQLAQGVALPGGDSLAISSARAGFGVEAGIARVRELIVLTEFGRVTGEGTISLRDESLALRLNTDLRLPIPGLPQGLRIRAPVPLGGTLAAPRPDWGAVQGEAAGAVAGAVAGQALERNVPREFQAPAQELLRGLFGRGR